MTCEVSQQLESTGLSCGDALRLPQSKGNEAWDLLGDV